MPHLSIKDVPEVVAEALRRRAARHHRSLQGELMAIIEQAACESDGLGGPPPRPSLLPAGRTTMRRGWKTVEQIYAEHLARMPITPDDGLHEPTVDVIRRDRESR